MEERIRKFMDYKGISPSELADTIGVQRSNVTHVLKNRNKPSFQFIEKMLQVYPDLNAKWLLLGTGSMIEAFVKNRTLFDQLTEPVTIQNTIPEKSSTIPEKTETKPLVNETMPAEPKEKNAPSPPVEKKTEDNVIKDQFFSPEKPVERLIVFFKDQTFKVYYPSL
jgi:transcriptional regulator with XRE-family HTH domain